MVGSLKGRRAQPPPGYIGTAEASGLLGVSHSYVRRLAQNRAAGLEPSLGCLVLRSEGGKEYRYVLRIEVEQLRNSGAVRSRRPASGVNPAELVNPTEVVNLTEAVRGASHPAAQGTYVAGATSPPMTSDQDWELRLELAASNARCAGLEEQVATLRRLVSTLEGNNEQLRRRLGLLGRLQIQLVEGFAGTSEKDTL